MRCCSCEISHRVLLASVLLSAVPLTVTVDAHPGHFYTPFHADNLSDALKLAEQNHKLVFAYVTPAGSAPVGFLQTPTFRDGPLIDLLVRETVMVVLDAKRNADELSRYDVSELPRVLLLNAAGSARGSFAGALSSRRLHEHVSELLKDPQDLRRARAGLIERGPQHFFSRERLAAALCLHGHVDEAIEHYLWCWKTCVKGQDPAAVARRRLVFQAIAELVREHPRLRPQIDPEYSRVEQVLSTAKDDPVLARDLAEFNRFLGDESRTLTLFDRLPASSRARHGLFDRVFDSLVERRRYADVLEYIDPRPAFRGETRLATGRGRPWMAGTVSGVQRGTRRFAVRRGACLVEALAGCGRAEEARALVRDVLEFDPRPATRDVLADRVRRSGAAELVEFIRALELPPSRDDAE